MTELNDCAKRNKETIRTVPRRAAQLHAHTKKRMRMRMRICVCVAYALRMRNANGRVAEMANGEWPNRE